MKHILTRLRLRSKVSLFAVVVLAVLFLLRGCLKEDAKEVLEEVLPRVSVQRIEEGLSRSFSTTGEVEAQRSANFQADFTATVEDIPVRVGEKVQTGQTLVVLRSPEIEQDFVTANALYVTSSQNLTQTRLTAQQNVDDARIAVKTAQINLEKLLKENAARRVQAEQSLKSATLAQELSQASAQTSLENAIRSTQTTVRDALVIADELLEFSPVQEGLTYTKETHLGVRDPSQKLRTSDALIVAYGALQTYRPTYTNARNLLASTEDAMEMVLTVLTNSVTSPEYTQGQLNIDIDTVNNSIASLRSAVSSLESAKRQLDSTAKKSGTESQVVIDAKAQYATTIAQLDASEQKARLEVERASNTLETANASARASEISAISSVTSARGQLDQARISKDKLALLAPFEGVVTDIPVRLGREVAVGELVAAIEDATALKVITFVSAEEVRSIRAGETARINGDMSATILSIAPSADPQSKKYKVELSIEGAALLPGEFVRVEFTGTMQKDSAEKLYLPVTAVFITAAQTYVWVIEEDAQGARAWKAPITLGDISGKYIEITRGISEGDAIVIDGGRALSYDGQKVEFTSQQ